MLMVLIEADSCGHSVVTIGMFGCRDSIALDETRLLI